MNKKVFLEGDVSVISLSNIGELEDFEFNIDDINEESDIVEIMEQLDAYAESAELDLVTDIKKFRVIHPEDIRHLSVQEEDAEEKEVHLDDFTLLSASFAPVKDLLESAKVGELIYLRKVQGSSNWEYSLQVESPDETLNFSYFDCTNSLEQLDQYALLSQSYYNILCDSIMVDSLSSKEGDASIENFHIEPTIVYAELYKVTENGITGEKILERLDAPGYYFLDKTRQIDE